MRFQFVTFVSLLVQLPASHAGICKPSSTRSSATGVVTQQETGSTTSAAGTETTAVVSSSSGTNSATTISTATSSQSFSSTVTSLVYVVSTTTSSAASVSSASETTSAMSSASTTTTNSAASSSTVTSSSSAESTSTTASSTLLTTTTTTTSAESTTTTTTTTTEAAPTYTVEASVNGNTYAAKFQSIGIGYTVWGPDDSGTSGYPLTRTSDGRLYVTIGGSQYWCATHISDISDSSNFIWSFWDPSAIVTHGYTYVTTTEASDGTLTFSPEGSGGAILYVYAGDDRWQGSYDSTLEFGDIWVADIKLSMA